MPKEKIRRNSGNRGASRLGLRWQSASVDTALERSANHQVAPLFIPNLSMPEFRSAAQSGVDATALHGASGDGAALADLGC